jgi:hypothetical protein
MNSSVYVYVYIYTVVCTVPDSRLSVFSDEKIKNFQF